MSFLIPDTSHAAPSHFHPVVHSLTHKFIHSKRSSIEIVHSLNMNSFIHLFIISEAHNQRGANIVSKQLAQQCTLQKIFSFYRPQICTQVKSQMSLGWFQTLSRTKGTCKVKLVSHCLISGQEQEQWQKRP